MELHRKKQMTTNEQLYFRKGVGVGRDLPLRFSSRGSSSPLRRRDAQRRPFALRYEK
jgi:hypothetical protein